MGGINLKWNKDGEVLEYAPTVRDHKEIIDKGYYMLLKGTILLLFHSCAALNVAGFLNMHISISVIILFITSSF